MRTLSLLLFFLALSVGLAKAAHFEVGEDKEGLFFLSLVKDSSQERYKPYSILSQFLIEIGLDMLSSDIGSDCYAFDVIFLNSWREKLYKWRIEPKPTSVDDVLKKQSRVIKAYVIINISEGRKTQVAYFLSFYKYRESTKEFEKKISIGKIGREKICAMIEAAILRMEKPKKNQKRIRFVCLGKEREVTFTSVKYH